MKLPKLSQAIYVVGGILIVLSAIQVVYSGWQYAKAYLKKERKD